MKWGATRHWKEREERRNEKWTCNQKLHLFIISSSFLFILFSAHRHIFLFTYSFTILPPIVLFKCSSFSVWRIFYFPSFSLLIQHDEHWIERKAVALAVESLSTTLWSNWVQLMDTSNFLSLQPHTHITLQWNNYNTERFLFFADDDERNYYLSYSITSINTLLLYSCNHLLFSCFFSVKVNLNRTTQTLLRRDPEHLLTLAASESK